MSQNYSVAPLTATRESLQAAAQTGPTKNKHINNVKVKVKSCPTLYDPVACSPPGSSIHGILQARILEADALTSEPPGKPINKRFFLSDKDSKPGLKLT